MITLKFSVLARYCCILAGLFLISAREAAPYSHLDNYAGEPICITVGNHNIYLIGPNNNGAYKLEAKILNSTALPDLDAYFFVILPDGNFTTLSRFEVTNQISTPFSKEIKLQYPAGQTSPLMRDHIQAWTMKKNDPDPPKRPSESVGGITPIYQPFNTLIDQPSITPSSSTYLASIYLDATESIKIGTSWSPWTHNDAYYYLIVSFANKTGNDEVSSGEVTISNCMQSDPTGFVMEEWFTYDPYTTNAIANWPPNIPTLMPINTNTYTFQFRDLNQNQEVRHIYIKMRKNGVPSDSIAQYKAEIKYKILDTIIDTMTKITACKTIILGTSPHDPNRKTVNHDSCTAKATGLLTYRIQFQNEGAGVARDVIVEDLLPQELFPYQIAVTQSSASQYLTTTVSSTGKATFTFGGINLPGTAQTIRRIYDYNETVGWVEFACTAVCPDKGKSISNKADIIFVGDNDVAQPAIPTKAINTKSDTTSFTGWNIINSESPCRPKHCCRIGWGRCKWYFCRFRECRTKKSANTIKSNY